MSTAEKLLNLFDRPTEPVFMPKGPNEEVFDVPPSYLPDRYKDVEPSTLNRFGETKRKIPVKPITLPDISVPLKLGRRDNFTPFIPVHRKMAGRLIDVLMGMRNIDDFLSACVYCRDRVNPYMFVYALSIAMLHRPDTKNLPIPPLCEIFPEKYVDGDVFARAREETNVIDDSSIRIPLTIPKDYTASDMDIEHRIAYFREDLGINIHHWHWHLVYPFSGRIEIVNKDRRGELFYYMHQQINARYNFERFSNQLSRVKRLSNFREPIVEAYFSKMDSLVSSRTWPAREANSSLKDIDRSVDELKFDISDLERWRSRIYEAIHTGTIVDTDGRKIPLDENRGIDLLGNIVEASTLSINPDLYGDLHNLGHIAISLVHDPDHRHLETFGIMGDPATDMRDPLFYRWHGFVDDIFQEHKNLLPRYTEQKLTFPGVRIRNAEIITKDETNKMQAKNQLFTFWQQSDVDFSRGFDFSPRGAIFARFTHLQHSPFSYKIEVDGPTNSFGTVRIFLAPKFDERGTEMLFRDQKHLFIEMDKFVAKINGRTTINRRSRDSSVTVPFERTFRNLDENRPTGGPELERFNFCGCGWPQHMLVPKGNAAGLPCQLFVMISDYRKDMVSGSDAEGKPCSDAATFCGVRDSKYPDSQAMGYPFDRLPRDGADSLDQFLTPNMFVRDVTIKFTDRTVVPSKPGSNVAPQ